ncbi:MAG: hypothetical protein NT027_12675 [Proteobacteria bacterium]|nr:hypothetical protein [Pseudomonadota bacterium]
MIWLRFFSLRSQLIHYSLAFAALIFGSCVSQQLNDQSNASQESQIQGISAIQNENEEVKNITGDSDSSNVSLTGQNESQNEVASYNENAASAINNVVEPEDVAVTSNNESSPADNASTSSAQSSTSKVQQAVTNQTSTCEKCELTWVGYVYQRLAKKVDVQLVTRGQPRYGIFHEVNRLGQTEIVVRFSNTKLRPRIRRDIDASEFYSPVSFIRVRNDKANRNVDLVLTLRDEIVPEIEDYKGHIILSFIIPDRWLNPAVQGSAPIAKLSLHEDSNLSASVGMDASATDQSSTERSIIEPMMNEPDYAKAAFPKNRTRHVRKLVPKENSKELVPLENTIQSGDRKSGRSPSVNNNSIKYTSFSIVGVAQANGSTDLPPSSEPVLTQEVTGVDPSLTVSQNSSGVSSRKKIMKFDFRNATIGSVLRAIAAESGLNFLMEPDISAKKVTVSLTNVPWDIALKAVLETSKLGMEEISPGIIRVDTMKSFVEDREAQTRAKQSTAALSPTKTLVVKLSYALAETAAKLVSELMPKPGDSSDLVQKRNFERFKVNYDKRSNAVIVEATASELVKIKSLLDRIDTQTPQVKISSRIVEVISTLEESFGISWGSPFNFDGGRGTGFGSLPFPNSISSTFAVDPVFRGQPAGAVSMKLGSINNSVALDINLKALETKNLAESIQNQDVLVEDNEEATIVAGLEDYFSIPAQGTVAATPFKVNYDTTLRVRPHITADGAVQMKLEIEGDTPVQKLAENSLAGKTTRRIKTTLIRKSGDTAVIGGLYANDKSKSESAVPFLSKLPIIGALFRSTNKQDTKRDLLIMITPTIQSGVTDIVDYGDSTLESGAPMVAKSDISNIDSAGAKSKNSQEASPQQQQQKQQQQQGNESEISQQQTSGNQSNVSESEDQIQVEDSETVIDVNSQSNIE